MTVNQKMAYHTTKSQSPGRLEMGVLPPAAPAAAADAEGTESSITTERDAGRPFGVVISPLAPDCARCLVTCLCRE